MNHRDLFKGRIARSRRLFEEQPRPTYLAKEANAKLNVEEKIALYSERYDRHVDLFTGEELR